ncbi:LPS export ABC transporter periplasmic protein LptC [Thermithiobacillus plumbiphilus]|uniref:LPS export ABC transporter periplasmic protein LptC n=1 Tax=Thermithiobacillus plumbiphilus TaxID=1729899 RepID=A0ABU9D8U7_9PROT
MRLPGPSIPAFSPAALLTILALLLILVLTWQEPQPVGPNLDWGGSLQSGDLAVENVRLSQYRVDGSLEFHAEAAQAYHDPQAGATFLYKLRALRPQAGGPVAMQATGGRVQDDSGIVSLYQSVRVQMAPDYHAETDMLRYDPRAGLMTSPSAVRLIRGDDWMSGVGMRMSIPAGTAQLLSQVRAYYAP